MSASLNHCKMMGAEPGRRFLKQSATKLEPVIVVLIWLFHKWQSSSCFTLFGIFGSSGSGKSAFQCGDLQGFYRLALRNLERKLPMWGTLVTLSHCVLY